LTDLSGVWIDRVHDRRPPKMITLDLGSSVSPTYGDQEGTAYNGHFGCTCYHPLFLFNWSCPYLVERRSLNNCHFGLESDRRLIAERGVSSRGIVEAINIAANSVFGQMSGLETGPPDEL